MDAQLAAAGAVPTTEEKNWAMGAHLSSLVAIAGLPFGHLIGPLIVYLVKGNQSRFIGQHSRAAMNYQLTVTIAAIAAILVAGVVLMLVLLLTPAGPGSDATSSAIGLGMVFFWIVAMTLILVIAIMSLVFIIMGTMAAGEGRPYVYPFSIHFFKEPAA